MTLRRSLKVDYKQFFEKLKGKKIAMCGIGISNTPLIMNFLSKGAKVYAHNDHRIAMSLAIAATVAEGEVKITNSECVKKSYGNFWDDYFSLQNR